MLDLKRRSDARAVRKVLAGHRESFDALVTRYQSLVYHVALSHVGNPADAEDLVQDAFLKAFRSLDGLKEPQRFSAWIVSIVRNSARDFLKRRGVQDAYAQSADEPLPQAPDVEAREARRILWRHLEQLDEAQRELLVLHYFEGKRTRELAALYDISTAACAKRLQRARQTLAVEVLNSLGMAADDSNPRDVRKRVMGAIATAPVAWDAKAVAAAQATGATTIGGLSVKVAGGAMVVTGGLMAAVMMTTSQAPQSPLGESVLAMSVVERGEATPGETAAAVPTDEEDTPEYLESMAEDRSGRISKPRHPGSGALVGMVTGPDGAPVSDARVVIDGIKNHFWRYPSESEARRVQHTGPDGSFRFDSLPAPEEKIAASYVLMAFSEDLAAVIDTHHFVNDSTEEISLQLEPARRLLGTVTDPQGRPVANARVYPVRTDTDERDRVFQAIGLQVMTDARGQFSLRGLSVAPWELVVVAEEFAPRRTPMITTEQEEVAIVLEAGATVRGPVLDADTGERLANVQVQLTASTGLRGTSFSPWTTRNLSTGADGFFEANHVAPGTYRLALATFFEENFVNPTGGPNRVSVEVPRDGETIAPDFVVMRGGGISGHVLDPATKVGVDGVNVTILVNRTSAPRPVWSTKTTDTEGRYQFTGLPEGEHLLQLEQQNQTRQSVVIASQEQVNGVDLIHHHASVVSGVVVDEHGAPVPGARVWTNFLPASGAVEVDADGPDGRFEMRGLPAMKEFYLVARTARRQSAVAGPLTLSPGTPQGVTLVLDKSRSAAIAGVVVGKDGRGIAKASVRANPPASVRNLGGSATTNGQGAFRIDRLAEGGYTMEVVLPGVDMWREGEGGLEIALAAGELLDGLRLESNPGESALVGRVVDSQGRPVKGAMVALFGPTVGQWSTGRDGRFRLERLEEGSYRLHISHEDFSPTNLEDVISGRDDLEVVLAGLGRITGRVVRADTGKAIEVFELATRQSEYRALYTDAVRQLAGQTLPFRTEDGRFDLTKVEAGTSTIIALADGLAPGFVTVDAITPGQTIHDVVIRLSPGQSARGIVHDGAGVPIHGAQLFHGNIDNRSRATDSQPASVTGQDGVFSLEGIPEQVISLSVVHPEYAIGVVRLPQPGAGSTPLDITLVKGATLSGTVLLNGQAPNPLRAMISLDPMTSDTVSESTVVDGQGRYRMEELLPGEVNLRASIYKDENRRERWSQTLTVDIQPETGAQVDIEFTEGDATVSGHVLDESGLPLGGLVMGELESEGQILSLAIALDENWNYAISNLPAGRLTLWYPGPYYEAPVEVTVDLHSGDRLTRDMAFPSPRGGDTE